MFKFCNHKLGKVENDNYQYCKKCGKAFPVECQHIFIDIAKYEIVDALVGSKGFKQIAKCSKCGIYKDFTFRV
jgi:hypothetical protein